MERAFQFIFLILFALIISIFLPGCSRQEIADQGKIKVAATTFPVYDILRQVGGDRINPVLILPAGASPHTFDPTPAQIAAVNQAEIFFVVGAGIDDWALGLLPANRQVKVVDLSKDISLRQLEHEGLDPHYWLDPENAKIMAGRIAQELALLDVANSQEYKDRTVDFQAAIDNAIISWQTRLSALPTRQIAVFHDAWGYFAERFALDIVATFEPFPGKAPSPQYLISIQEEIKNNQVKALFIEPQLSSEAAEALAQELGVKISRLDPIGGFPETDSYLDLINYNIEAIYGALLASQ